MIKKNAIILLLTVLLAILLVAIASSIGLISSCFLCWEVPTVSGISILIYINMFNLITNHWKNDFIFFSKDREELPWESYFIAVAIFSIPLTATVGTIFSSWEWWALISYGVVVLISAILSTVLFLGLIIDDQEGLGFCLGISAIFFLCLLIFSSFSWVITFALQLLPTAILQGKVIF